MSIFDDMKEHMRSLAESIGTPASAAHDSAKFITNVGLFDEKVAQIQALSQATFGQQSQMLQGQKQIAATEGRAPDQSPMPAPQLPGQPPAPAQVQPKVTPQKQGPVRVVTPKGEEVQMSVKDAMAAKQRDPSVKVSIGDVDTYDKEGVLQGKPLDIKLTRPGKPAPKTAADKMRPGDIPKYLPFSEIIKHVKDIDELEALYPGISAPAGLGYLPYVRGGTAGTPEMLMDNPALMVDRVKKKQGDK